MSDISIIVPIYNAEKYLNKCIDSLVNQTKKELEIILINDGSKDDSEKVIKEYKDKRIKYFKNKNQGIGKTRNFGIEKATGKYILFVDSDDYIEKDTCEIMFNKGETDKLELVVCDFYKNYDNKEQEEIKLIDFKDTSLKENKNLLLEINLAPWNKLYKKKLITENKLKFNENLKYEDTQFVASALKYAKKIGKVNKCLNHYIIHESSETTIRDERIFDILKIVDIVRNNFKEEEYREVIDKLTVQILTNYTIQQRVNINNEASINFIDQAFEYLKENVPDYKHNKYYEKRSFLKKNIEKNKILTKIYCKIYRVIKKDKNKLLKP